MDEIAEIITAALCATATAAVGAKAKYTLDPPGRGQFPASAVPSRSAATRSTRVSSGDGLDGYMG